MSHATQVIEYKQLSDGQFAISVCCCDDPIHVLWLTVDASIVLDPVKMQEALDAHIARLVVGHEGAMQAKTSLAALVGTIITTDDSGNAQS